MELEIIPLDMWEDSVRRLLESLIGNYVLEDSVRRLPGSLSGRLPKFDSDLKNLHIQKRSNAFKTEKMGRKLDKSIFIKQTIKISNIYRSTLKEWKMRTM